MRGVKHEAPGSTNRVHGWFRKLASCTALAAASPWAFVLAATTIVVWALCGKLFNFSDTWQLIINTGTTIVTFLMVFLIQNTQNRDGRAMQLKLDELLRAVQGARNGLVDLEGMSDEELERLQKEFSRMRQRAAADGNEDQAGAVVETAESINARLEAERGLRKRAATKHNTSSEDDDDSARQTADDERRRDMPLSAP